jgi:hypothetical protein
MGEFTKYAIRIRKTMKFKEYVTRFSRKIKVDQTMLAFRGDREPGVQEALRGE